jgi:conjugative transfer region protein TrbK
MNPKTLEPLPRLAAVLLVVITVAACAIRLRGDEEPTETATSTEMTLDPLATKLRECRAVTYGQLEALSECRKAWAAQRQQFLGQKTSAPSDRGLPQAGSSLFVAPKDESRSPSANPPIQQTGKE